MHNQKQTYKFHRNYQALIDSFFHIHVRMLININVKVRGGALGWWVEGYWHKMGVTVRWLVNERLYFLEQASTRYSTVQKS